MNETQKAMVKSIHNRLSSLIQDYNNHELTVHDWEGLYNLLIQMEIDFSEIVDKSQTKLTRKH
jgi:hypothetical protein